MTSVELSALEQKILHLIAHDASDLDATAASLDVPRSALDEAIAGLRARGAIDEICARVVPAARGLGVTAFLLIRVAQTADTREALEQLIRDIDQVEEAHAISGPYDWLVKVRATSLADLQGVLADRFALLPGFARAETMVVLSTACDYVNVEAATIPPE